MAITVSVGVLIEREDTEKLGLSVRAPVDRGDSVPVTVEEMLIRADLDSLVDCEAVTVTEGERDAIDDAVLL